MTRSDDVVHAIARRERAVVGGVSYLTTGKVTLLG